MSELDDINAGAVSRKIRAQADEIETLRSKLAAMTTLIEQMGKVIEEYSTTLANNRCVDYHVCCGVASDLSHSKMCEAIKALTAYKEMTK
jgi:hypothetical protein